MCRNCSSTGRECGGYEVGAARTDRAASRAILLPRQTAVLALAPQAVLPVLPNALSESELQAYDYFRSRAVYSLSGQFSSAVWRYLVLQISQQQQPTLHAAVAVGSLYRARRELVGSQRSAPIVSVPYQLALKQYGVAMAKLRTLIQTAPLGSEHDVAEITMVCCLLFVCFEMLQGDQRSVLFHLVKSLKIMREKCSRYFETTPSRRVIVLRPDSKTITDSLHDVLVRLDSDSTMFGRRQPYLHPTAIEPGMTGGSYVPDSFVTLDAAKTHLDRISSAAFELRGELIKIIERDMPFGEHGSEDWSKRYCIAYAKARRINLHDHPKLANLKAELLEAFKIWSTALENMRSRLQPGQNSAWTLLRIQHFYPWYITETFQDAAEQFCDLYEETFENTINLAEQYQTMTTAESKGFAFKLEPEILGTLYLIGTKSRKSSTRRKAIALLRESTTQEGLWNGQLHALFVSKFVQLEEDRTREFLGIDGEVDYIPEAVRFSDVMFRLDPESPGWGTLVCVREDDLFEDGVEVYQERFRAQITSGYCTPIVRGASCVYFKRPWERTVGLHEVTAAT